jgi:tRNA/rRNA methyltransferase
VVTGEERGAVRGGLEARQHFAKPPFAGSLDRLSRQARQPLEMSGVHCTRNNPDPAHLEPASSEVEMRRRETGTPADRPGPAAAGGEYREGGAGDAQFRADRPAAGGAAGRLAEPGGRAGRFGSRCGAGARPRVRIGRRGRGPIARTSTPPPSASAGSSFPVATPEQAALRIRSSPQASAILFGAERSGLETEEAAVAGTIITVPINPGFRSLNLPRR